MEVYLECAGCGVTSCVTSHIGDLIYAPQQSLSRPVSAFFLHTNHAYVVTEMRFIPSY